MKLLYIIPLIACLLFHTTYCEASAQIEVSVVFSSDIDAYEQAWSGFQNFLIKNNIILKVISKYNLKEIEPNVLCSQINRERPDIVITLGMKASTLIKENISNIPVVSCMVLSHSHLKSSNMTGVSMKIPAKIKIEGIKKILPDTKNIGLIFSLSKIEEEMEISDACSHAGLNLVAKPVESKSEFASALQDISKVTDCFLMILDSKIYSQASVNHLLLLSLRNKYPVIGLSSTYTKAGAIFSYDCDYEDLGRQAGMITLEIIDGKSPSEIFPMFPRKYNISLNLTVAERMGIDIPARLIDEASEVFGN